MGVSGRGELVVVGGMDVSVGVEAVGLGPVLEGSSAISKVGVDRRAGFSEVGNSLHADKNNNTSSSRLTSF